jgi:hypothetical protein
MKIEAILQELEHLTGRFPRQAVEAAIANQEAITPHLLQVLEDAAGDIDRLIAEQDYMLPHYAFYLLAQFRETRAYPLLVQLFATPGETIMDVAGDFVTEDLGRVLASVSDGDMAPMKRLIEDPQVNEYVRNAAMGGMLTLLVEGVVPRETVIAYFGELFRGKLERTYSFAWDGLVSNSTRLYPEELWPDIQQAFADGLVDEVDHIDLPFAERALSEGKTATLAWLDKNPHYHFVNDIVRELGSWACFQPPPPPPSLRPATQRKKVGRNAPCPCGSGKKYKYCCGKRR